MKKRFLKVTAFLLAVAITLAGAAHVLDFKYMDSIFKVDSFYELEENTVDVLVLGSSHAYQGFNTAVFWEEYGIAAYNLCGAAQPLWNTYFYLEEALKTQTPKVILLDAYYVHMTDDFGDTSYAIKNTYGLKWSDTKVEAIKASFDTETVGNQYFFSILQYHSRYSDLSRTDFYPYHANRDMYENHKGFYCYFRSEAVEDKDFSDINYYNEMTEKVEYYYRRIFELANSHNIPVIVAAIPFNAENYHQGYFNEAKYIAEKEYNSQFYNFLTDYKEELGIDYKTDFSDAQHLNYLGNTKLTRFFGDLLKSQYDIPDRRGDEKYASWQADADVYYNQLENHNVTKIQSFAKYADVFRNERYTVIMTSSFKDIGLIDSGALGRMVNFCQLLGIPQAEYAAGGIWVFEGGEKTYYNDCSAENFRKIINLEGYTAIEIRKTEKAYNADGTETFFVNSILSGKSDITKADNGLNIYVYDNFTRSRVDMISLNYSNNSIKR